MSILEAGVHHQPCCFELRPPPRKSRASEGGLWSLLPTVGPVGQSSIFPSWALGLFPLAPGGHRPGLVGLVKAYFCVPETTSRAIVPAPHGPQGGARGAVRNNCREGVRAGGACGLWPRRLGHAPPTPSRLCPWWPRASRLPWGLTWTPQS